MATDTSGSAPHTALVPGQGSSTVTYTLPAGLFQYIQSVVATVDTTASGAVTPLLTIRDDGGEVVADQAQDDALSAGGVGRSTWALGLRKGGAGGIRFDVDNVGDSLLVETTTGGMEFDVHGGNSYTIVLDGPGGGFYVYTPFVYYDVGGGHFRLLNSDLFDVQATAVSLSVGVGGVTTGTTGKIADTADSMTVDIATSEAHTVTGSFIVNAGDIELDGLTTVHGGNLEVTIPNAGSTIVRDHNANEVFRIDDDGTIHGLASVGAITWDL